MSALLLGIAIGAVLIVVDNHWLRGRLAQSAEREEAAEFLLERAAGDVADLVSKLADSRAETAAVGAQLERVAVEREAARTQGERAVTLLTDVLERERAEREEAHAASLLSLGATLAWPLVIQNGELRAEVERLRAAVEAGDRVDVAYRELIGKRP